MAEPATAAPHDPEYGDGGEARVFSYHRQYLYALNPKTGAPIPTFGTNGRVDLAASCTGLVNPKSRLSLGERLGPGDAIVLLGPNNDLNQWQMTQGGGAVTWPMFAASSRAGTSTDTRGRGPCET